MAKRQPLVQPHKPSKKGCKKCFVMVALDPKNKIRTY